MTTHEGHDHPNTKAARAACRRAAGLIGDRKSASSLPKMSAEEKARIKANKPAVRGKAKKDKANQRRVEKPINTSLPHAFDEDMERPGRCYVCKLTRTARIHTAGPSDLASRLF